MKINNQQGSQTPLPFDSNSSSNTQNTNTRTDTQVTSSSIINNSEDIVSLSATALKTYFASQASSRNLTPVTKSINGNSYQINNGTPAVQINGSSNKVTDSTANDLSLIIGSSNQITTSKGTDSFLISGNKNKITNSNNIDTAIVGDSNQITASNSATVTAAIKGASNKVTSSGGQDFIISNGKSNTFDTGEGEDSIIFYGDSNKITAGAGNDVVIADGASYNISLGTGDDTITADGSGTINGESGNDIIELKDTANTVNGGDGNDTIIFYKTGNTIKGDAGNDTLQVKLTEGSVTVYGGGDTDTVQLDIKRADYSAISNDSDVTFYSLVNQTKRLKITFSDIENFKFSDGETLSIEEVRNLKGSSYQIQENKDKTVVKNTNSSVNVFDLNVPLENIIKGTKTSSGVKITYKNSKGQQKTIEEQNFKYLKTGSTYINLKTYSNFDFLNVNPDDALIITSEISSSQSQTKFYDKQTESLLLSTNYTPSVANFIFKDGTILTGTELQNNYNGKSIDVDTNSTSVTPSNSTTNTANLKFSSDLIYKLEKTGIGKYDIYYKKSETETGKISLNNISYLQTSEGDLLSISKIYQATSSLRSNEKSRSVYTSDQQSTEFRRSLYNLTGKITYIDSLIDGDYDKLTDTQKTTLQSNASILESSMTFQSDYSDKSVDNATKKLFTLRVANLLKNRSDVLEKLAASKLKVYYTKSQDLGGDSSGFVTGYATYFNSSGSTRYETHFVYSAFYGGLADGNDGDDVGTHEVMHILDFLNLKDDGIPFGITDSNSTSYKAERDNLFAQYNNTQNDVGVIREYGFSNTLEFLAVATENFYERPTDLNATSSNLYSALSEYFKV